VLVGQLNLNPLLKAPQMRQLDQRVSIRYQLRPLSRDEVASYVSHRLMIAGGSVSVSFQPKALDMVHSRTQGIPRLINLLCDRSLLAAYSSRTNRISADIVYQAAENLELVEARPSRFSWFRRRASVVVMAAGASASLGVVGSMAAPTVRAFSASADLRAVEHNAVPVAGAVDPVSLDARPGATTVGNSAATEPRYSVIAASFPGGDATRAPRLVGAPIDTAVVQLKKLGYEVRVIDVDLGDSGQWRRVLVGEFATWADAKAQADLVRQTPAFADAQVIGY
jgi:hypothetical protein